MGMGAHFVTVWIVVMAYLVVANSVYFVKVLPTLREAGRPAVPRFGASHVMAQFRECRDILAQRGQRGPIYWFLRAQSGIILALVAAMATLVLRALWHAGAGPVVP